MIHSLLPLKNFFTLNFRLKLTSILLALLLWVAINGEPKSEIGFKVPLEYRNPPDGIEVLDVGESINTIDVRLSAASSVIKRLDATDIAAVVDLSGWNLGEKTFPITSANIRAPFGVSITKVTPSSVRLKFERTAQKTVEIASPHLLGKVAEGYKISSVTCNPSSVEIEGPEERVSLVSRVFTDSIDVSGRSEPFKIKTHLYVEDPLLRFSGQQETLVEVVINRVDPEKEKRT